MYIFKKKVGGKWLAKWGVPGHNDNDLNWLPEDVSEWSVPSRFGGSCKRSINKSGEGSPSNGDGGFVK